MEIAHTRILPTKAAAGSNISRIRWSQLIGEDRLSLGRFNVHLFTQHYKVQSINCFFHSGKEMVKWSAVYLSDDVFQRNSWKDLFDGRCQIGDDDISILMAESGHQQKHSKLVEIRIGLCPRKFYDVKWLLPKWSCTNRRWWQTSKCDHLWWLKNVTNRGYRPTECLSNENGNRPERHQQPHVNEINRLLRISVRF